MNLIFAPLTEFMDRLDFLVDDQNVVPKSTAGSSRSSISGRGEDMLPVNDKLLALYKPRPKFSRKNVVDPTIETYTVAENGMTISHR